jgi:hypothetical protein
MTTRIPLTVDQGTTFTYVIALLDDNGIELDTTNLTANAAMRKSYAASNSVVFTTNVSNGQLTLSLTPTQTGNSDAGRYVYDVKMTNLITNVITKPIEGVVTVKATATR